MLGEVCYGSASASSSKHVERTVSSLSFSVSPFVLLFPPALPPFLARVSPLREMTLVEGNTATFRFNFFDVGFAIIHNLVGCGRTNRGSSFE